MWIKTAKTFVKHPQVVKTQDCINHAPRKNMGQQWGLNFCSCRKKEVKNLCPNLHKRRMLTICVKLLHKCFLIRLEKVDITCNTSYNMHINV